MTFGNKKRPIRKKLTDREKEFVSTFLLTGIIRKTAEVMGISEIRAHVFHRRPQVQKALIAKRNEVAQRCDITLNEVMNELQRIAFFDHKSYLKKLQYDTKNGDYEMVLRKLEEMDTRALSEITFKKKNKGGYEIGIKAYNKMDALKELANRLQGTNGDKHLHLHLDQEKFKDMTSKEAAAAYMSRVQKKAS